MPPEIQLFTIGFTQKTAEHFFEALRKSGVKRVVDVRLSNNRTLAGFSKKSHLPYLLKEIAGIDYVHEPKLAPTDDIFVPYRTKKVSWDVYEKQFLALMAQREIEKVISPELLDGGCLLCSEHEPHHCHRRVVADCLNRKWGCVRVAHLK